MKRKYSKQQSNYLLAKANLEVLENQEQENEYQYILAHNITNPDGATPTSVYMIEDDGIFEKANQETAAIVESSGLWAEILEARQLLKEAEDNLIEFALSLAPAKERNILLNDAKKNIATKLKIIDLAIKLDVTTI